MVNNLEETATLGIATPPAGATYTLVDSAGDIGTWVYTNLTQKPTLTTGGDRINGNSADIAWSDPQYIAASGAINSSNTGTGYWSGDGGKTWTTFASLPAGATTNTSSESSLVVTARNKAVWAPANSVPSYTTDNGATWTATNLPALPAVGWNRGYRLVVDRKNPNKVYAYDSGGAWWASAGRVYVSTDGGHSFALSGPAGGSRSTGAAATAAGMRPSWRARA